MRGCVGWCGARVDAPFGGGWWEACGGAHFRRGGAVVLWGLLVDYGALFLDKKLSLKSFGKLYIPCV